jgi:pimeloyl-ACP methyl ester carboxylesterase
MSTTTAPTTQTTTSADGTPIAYEVTGTGPALVIVDGALCQRAMGPSRPLAAQLTDEFTVHAYDRRGRGESGPGSSPYAVDREVEDLLAVIDAAGGHAHVLAASSGATLALEAARAGAPIDRLAVYEAPFIVDDSHAPNPRDLPQTVERLVEEGRRAEAVKTFLRVVGVPGPFLAIMPLMPAWKEMVAVAHTLTNDFTIVIGHQQGEPIPAGYYDRVPAPTLVLLGAKSPAYMHSGQRAIADAVPGARLMTLPGQTHMIKAPVVAPVVAEFLRGA